MKNFCYLKSFGKFLLDVEYRIQCEVHFLLWIRKYKIITPFVFLLKGHLSRVRYVRIADKARIGYGLRLPHPHNVIIGLDAEVGNDCTIYHDVTIGQSKGYYPRIGNNVIVYSGAKVLGNIHIGDNVIIGANSVVTHDVPDNAIVGGIPAKIIRYRSKEDGFY